MEHSRADLAFVGPFSDFGDSHPVANQFGMPVDGVDAVARFGLFSSMALCFVGDASGTGNGYGSARCRVQRRVRLPCGDDLSGLLLSSPYTPIGMMYAPIIPHNPS